MTVNYRCTSTKCGKPRITLKKRKELYVRTPTCPSCGGNIALQRKDKLRNTARVCNCDGYPYPHHKGTKPWCVVSEVTPTNEDWEALYKNK